MSTVTIIVLMSRIAILAAAAWAAVVDVRERLVPYTTMAVVAASGTLIRVLTPHDHVWPSVVGAFVVFVVLSLLAGAGVFGGGDAKLIAAAALGLAPQDIVPLLLEIALAGGALACVYLIGWRFMRERTGEAGAEGDRHSPGALARLLRMEAARMGAREPMPYAVAILAALLWRTTPEVLRCLSSVSCSS
jgi:prepilin peptidase CpaA